MEHSKEELRAIQLRYLSDRKIATLHNEIAAIYSSAIPQAIFNKKGAFDIFFGDKVEYEVQRVKNILSDYIKENYPELLETLICEPEQKNNYISELESQRDEQRKQLDANLEKLTLIERLHCVAQIERVEGEIEGLNIAINTIKRIDSK